MDRYTNKYFREVLEKELHSNKLGVNIHCKEDGIHVTVPPEPLTDKIEVVQEDFNTEKLLDKIKKIVEPFDISVKLDKVINGDADNQKLKLRAFTLKL